MSSKWIVVTDFDGTITEKDIGNELCLEVFPDHFRSVHGRYKKGELDLKSMQKLLWEKFPYSEAQFIERSLFHGKLRPGVVDFLEKCADRNVPVYVASCGLLPYIESTLTSKLTRKARSAILEIRSNLVEFDATSISKFIPPATDENCPYPLDKGAWASELKIKLGADSQILGIGNGTSDRSFIGHVNLLAATEGLAEWCTKNAQPYIPFEDFRQLIALDVF